MIQDLLQESYNAMRHNRRRTALTMLGMAWGIATVVMLLAYGDGFGRACANIFAGSVRTAMVAAVIGTGLILPWVITVLSLVGAPLAAHVLIPIATAALTAYALRKLGSDPAKLIAEPASLRRPSTRERTSR